MKSKETIYRVARTRREIEGALSLVYKEYLRKGYISKGYKSKLRISLYNALPSSTTFVAKQGNKVLAGVTLVADSAMGLPMDKLYKKELDSVRTQGRRIAEVSQLAIDTNIFGEGFFSMFNFNKLIFVFKLFKAVLDYALTVDKLTDICIAINPKQQCLYKFLYFEQLGPLRYYSLVNRAPALAFKLNLTEAQEKAKNKKGLYKIFFGNGTDPELFEEKFKLTPDDLEYFFVKKSDIFANADKKQLNYIKSCYPANQEEIEKLFSKTCH